jgi:hypothetical protein
MRRESIQTLSAMLAPHAADARRKARGCLRRGHRSPFAEFLNAI